MRIKITKDEILHYLGIEGQVFTTYVAPILNLANQYAQGTRPAVVGQMSELIKEFNGKSLYEWEKWYLERKPKAIQKATEMIFQKIMELKDVLENIDRSIVQKWVRDLVITKTFIGLKFQEVILKRGAELKGVTYRNSTPVEESNGIDGFIGDIPISIKPDTYKLKSFLPEVINIKIIYYSKVKDGIEVDFGEII
jgi:hypothetical protein